MSGILKRIFVLIISLGGFAMSLESRKSLRLSGFSYDEPYWYFITMCTHGKQPYFADISDSVFTLSPFGEIALSELLNIPLHFPHVHINHYCMMPDHIHVILSFSDTERSRPFPTLSTVVGLYKSGVTKIIRRTNPDILLWQRSFYDHVIRNEEEYIDICRYIDENPLKLALQKFHLDQ